MHSTRHIATTVGQKNLADALGVGITAVNNAVVNGKFPSSWFPVVRKICARHELECPESLFNFKSPSSDASAGVSKPTVSCRNKNGGDADAGLQGDAA